MSVYRIKEVVETTARTRESSLGSLKAYLRVCLRAYVEHKPFIWAAILVIVILGSGFATDLIVVPAVLSAAGLVPYLWVCDVG